MNKKNKQEYMSPMVEQIVTRVEKGFQQSSPQEDPNRPESIADSGNEYDRNIFS